MNYFIYNDQGQILRYGYCNPSTFNQIAQAGEFVGAGIVSDLGHYIELVIFPGFTEHTPLIQDRPELVPLVNGLLISGLPIPCTATIDGQSHEILDGELELEPVYPGRYEVRFEAFPHKPATVVIDHEG